MLPALPEDDDRAALMKERPDLSLFSLRGGVVPLLKFGAVQMNDILHAVLPAQAVKITGPCKASLVRHMDMQNFRPVIFHDLPDPVVCLYKKRCLFQRISG